MQLPPVDDPLRKREVFAVSLRKDKKKSILVEKRKKISLVAKKDLVLNQDTVEIFIEYQGYWSDKVDFAAVYHEICATKLPAQSHKLEAGKMIWPSVDTINDVVAVLEQADRDLYTILTCLTLLRRMFTVTNQEEYSIAALLEHTKLVDTLNAVLERETADNLSIQQEVLWIILNMTYCCAKNKELEALVMVLFKGNSGKIRQLFTSSFQVDLDTERP